MSTDKKNWVRRLEAVVQPVYLVGLFILLMTLGFCKEGKTDEVSMEIGAAFLSGEYSEGQVLMFNERFDKYSIGVGFITDQEVTDRAEDTYFPQENIVLQGQRHVSLSDRFGLAFGAAYFNSTNRALGSNFQFTLSVHYQLNDRFSVQIRHWSNAGSARPNMGQDAITVGYHFGEQ